MNALLLLAASLGCGLSAESGFWHATLSPHFEVSHEAAFMPGGFTMKLERLHSRLRLDLAPFSPWMSKERLKLYLYKNRGSYAKGEFEPPEWSNGVSIYEKRLVAVYDQPDRAKLLEIIAHETTHLLFESYWGESGKKAPTWLNEGLAMVQEAEIDRAEKSDWHAAMTLLPRQGHIRVADFVKMAPTEDLKNDSARVQTWYVQAYSVSYFLLRKHPRLSFKTLCGLLRDGKPLDEALWLAYRYRGAAQLEKAWLKWLKTAAPRI
jgi:hypothetical protein